MVEKHEPTKTKTVPNKTKLEEATVRELSNELFSRELTLDQALDIESRLYPLPDGGDDGRK